MLKPERFSYQLQKGLEQVRARLDRGEFALAAREQTALAELTLPGALDLIRRPSQRPSEQDAVLLAVVRCCRRREPGIWMPVLLEMLAPALVDTMIRIARSNALVEPGEIQQQLIAEVINAALTMPLDEGSRWIQRRLIKQGAGRTRRWLRREAGLQAACLGEGRPERFDAVYVDEVAWDLADLRASNARTEDLWLVARIAVLREERHELATRLGISEAALEARYRRARARLRQLLPRERAGRSEDAPSLGKDAARYRESPARWQVSDHEAPTRKAA